MNTWEEMTFRYIAAVKEGARKMARMLPETVRKGEFRRKALTPMADGRSRWEYPTAFLTVHPAGFWQSIAVPRLEEKVSRNTRLTFLGLPSKRPTAGGHEANADEIVELDVRPPNSDYPAGQPLTEAEHRSCRNHRPKSLQGVRFL